MFVFNQKQISDCVMTFASLHIMSKNAKLQPF